MIRIVRKLDFAENVKIFINSKYYDIIVKNRNKA